MAGIRILGCGYSYGDRIVTNDDMAKIVDTSDAWIRRKTGIRQRYIAENKSNSDMAQEASLSAMKCAGVTAEEIDLIVVCTFTQDDPTPSMACKLAGKLGAGNDILTLDINSACSGFIYGCITANALLAGGSFRKALIIGAEKLSSRADMTDRRTCVLFGDGAGAIVCEYSEDGFFESNFGCMPNDTILGCGGDKGAIYMNGPEVYRFAVSKIPQSINELVEKTKVGPDEIDHVICHQANMRIIDSVAEKVVFPAEKFYKNIQNTGNTSAASIAICLGEMCEKGLLTPGRKILCSGFGGGLTWGSMIIKV